MLSHELVSFNFIFLFPFYSKFAYLLEFMPLGCHHFLFFFLCFLKLPFMKTFCVEFIFEGFYRVYFD